MILLKRLNSSLSGRALIYTIGNFALAASNFLASAIFVRMMSTSDYGLASVYLTWVALISQIVGLRIEGTIQNARLAYGEENIRGYCSSVLFFDLLVSLVVLTISILFIDRLAAVMSLERWVLIFVVITAFFLTCSNLRKNYCSATKNAPGDLLISCILAFGQIGLSVLFILFCFSGNAYHDRVLGYSVPTILVGIGICIFFFVRGRRFFETKYWRFCLSFSVPMIFNGIAFLLINQSDRLIINSMMGSSAAGIYSFVYTVALPISVLTQSLGTAWQPEYYELKARGAEDELKRHARRYTVNVLLISIALMCISPEILIVLGTEEYYSGVEILPLIIVGYYFQFLYTWPLNCELFHRKTVGIAFATSVAAILNILLNVILIPYLGLMGSALATCIAFIVLFFMHHVAALILINEYRMTLGWFAPYIIIALLAMIAITLVLEYWVIRWSLLVFVGIVLILRIQKSKSII